MSTDSRTGPQSWRVGQQLAPLTLGPLTRTMLALYAGGSGDHNPLHLDPEFARSAGLPDVIGHGMLTMALLARYVTHLVPQTALQSYSVRFLDMARVGDAIICSGSVQEIFENESGRLLQLQLSAARGNGEVLVSGTATIALARSVGADA